MTNPLDLNLRAVVQLLKFGKISATELIHEALATVERDDEVINAVIGISRDRALEEAARLDRLSPEMRGPLHGVPLAHKDMFYRKGEVSSFGSKQMGANVKTQTSSLLRRLDEAGAISFARLNMAQFAMGPTGDNPDFGRCRNPFAPDRISGGSSSGSAAAVAARYAFAALGSDTGGSIRLPAALCGVVGLKPTQNLMPTDGMMGLSESLDAPGPIARASGDVARIMDILLGRNVYEAALDAPQPVVRIGVPSSYYCDDLDGEVAASYQTAIESFIALGFEIVEVDVPDHTHFADLADVIWKPEAAALHLHTLQSAPHMIAVQARARLTQGLATSAVDYIRARQLRSAMLAEMLDGPLRSSDVLLTPAMRITPPLAVDVAATGGEAMRRNLEGITAFTRPLNFLGLPGLVTPAGLASSGTPLSIQIIGRPFAEPLLLQLGHLFEEHCKHNRLRPKIGMA